MAMIWLGELSIAVTRKMVKHTHLSVHPPHGRVTLVAPLGTRGNMGGRRVYCRAAAQSRSKTGWSSLLKILASRNPDLKALLEKGYALALDTNYLVVRDIPYLDAAGELKWGALVAKLVFEDDVTVRPEDHQAFWAGPAHMGWTSRSSLASAAEKRSSI